MKKLSGCLFVLFFVLQNSHPQKTAIDIVNEINSSISNSIFSGTKDIDGTVIYFDSNEQIRKFIKWYEYPESRGIYIGYYNEEGELIRILFCDSQPEGFSYQGCAYKQSNEFDWEDVIFNYKLQETNGTYFTINDIKGKSATFPILIGDWHLSQYTHTDSLVISLNTEYLLTTGKKGKVSFTAPVKGDETFINMNNVWVREKPSYDSKTVKMLETGDRIKILEIHSEKEEINSISYPWYKIKYYHTVGYISGVYLEAVERIQEK